MSSGLLIGTGLHSSVLNCHGSHDTEVRQAEPGEEDEWDRFVTSSPWGTFFHLYGWKALIEKTLNRRCFYLTARNGSGITGVFPISHTSSKLFGKSLISLPLSVYGGICANDQNSSSRLLQAGSDLARSMEAQYLEMRNRSEPFPAPLPGRDLYVTFTQDLSPGPDKLLGALPRDTRYMIRKSQKAGLEWTEDLTLNEFYELYARNVHRLGTPVFPKALFASIRSIFPKQCRLFGVRKGKTAIAGVLCFYFRNEVIPYYSGSLPEFYKDCPNNFMYWSLIAQSCREGFQYFDFGRSKKGTGSCAFKSSWSMQVTELPYRYKLHNARQVPKMSPVDPKFQKPVALWKRLPYSWTKIIGPRVIRGIPSI